MNWEATTGIPTSTTARTNCQIPISFQQLTMRGDDQLRLINACDQALSQFPRESLACQSETLMAAIHARFVGHESADSHAITSTMARFRTLMSRFEQVKRYQSRRRDQRQFSRASRRLHLDEEVYRAMARLIEQYPARVEQPTLSASSPLVCRDPWRPEELERVARAMKTIWDPALDLTRSEQLYAKFLDLGGSRKRTCGAVENIVRAMSKALTFVRERYQGDWNLWFNLPESGRCELAQNCSSSYRTVLLRMTPEAFRELVPIAFCTAQRPANLDAEQGLDTVEREVDRDEDMLPATTSEGEGGSTLNGRMSQDSNSPGGHPASDAPEGASSTRNKDRRAAGSTNNGPVLEVDVATDARKEIYASRRLCRAPWSTDELLLVATAMDELQFPDYDHYRIDKATALHSKFLSLGGTEKRTLNAVTSVFQRMLRAQRFVVGTCADTWDQWLEFAENRRVELAKGCYPGDGNVLLLMTREVFQALDRIDRSTGSRTMRPGVASAASASPSERDNDGTTSDEVFTGEMPEPDVNETSILPVPGEHQERANEGTTADLLNGHDFSALEQAAARGSRETSDSIPSLEIDNTQVNDKIFDSGDVAVASTSLPENGTIGMASDVDRMGVDRMEVDQPRNDNGTALFSTHTSAQDESEQSCEPTTGRTEEEQKAMLVEVITALLYEINKMEADAVEGRHNEWKFIHETLLQSASGATAIDACVAQHLLKYAADTMERTELAKKQREANGQDFARVIGQLLRSLRN